MALLKCFFKFLVFTAPVNISLKNELASIGFDYGQREGDVGFRIAGSNVTFRFTLLSSHYWRESCRSLFYQEMVRHCLSPA